MRLEQVLARWIRGDATSPEPRADVVTGRWTNEYGSVADLRVDGERLHGTYTSRVGADGASLQGPVNGFVRGDIVSFAVLWPAPARSITSWVGQVVDERGSPELRTLWQMVVDIPDPEEATGLWTTVHAGADTFR